MLKWKSKGGDKTEKFLKNAEKKIKNIKNLDTYGALGVKALREATPKKTGKTANSWSYNIVKTGNGLSIEWNNSNIVKGVPIAVIIQYGHGTGTGGYVQGLDYINPAMRSVFQKIAEDVWEEVTS